MQPMCPGCTLTTEPYSEHPPRVEYRLTEMGRDTLRARQTIVGASDPHRENRRSGAPQARVDR